MSRAIESAFEYDGAIYADYAIVKCWADWCKPCVDGAEAFEEFARSVSVPCYTLNIDTVPDFDHRDLVVGLPTFLIARRGVILHDTVGGGNLPLVKLTLDSLMK